MHFGLVLIGAWACRIVVVASHIGRFLIQDLQLSSTSVSDHTIQS